LKTAELDASESGITTPYKSKLNDLLKPLTENDAEQIYPVMKAVVSAMCKTPDLKLTDR